MPRHAGKSEGTLRGIVPRDVATTCPRASASGRYRQRRGWRKTAVKRCPSVRAREGRRGTEPARISPATQGGDDMPRRDATNLLSLRRCVGKTRSTPQRVNTPRRRDRGTAAAFCEEGQWSRQLMPRSIQTLEPEQRRHKPAKVRRPRVTYAHRFSAFESGVG